MVGYVMRNSATNELYPPFLGWRKFKTDIGITLESI